jgi:hypothetical protein
MGKSANATPIDLNSNPVIAKNLESLVGNNPAVKGLVDQAVTTEPDSPQAEQLKQQLAETMQQSGYSAGDIKKTNILISALHLNNVQATLQAIGGNVQPGSAEAQQIQVRLDSLQQIKATLSQELAQAN